MDPRLFPHFRSLFLVCEGCTIVSKSWQQIQWIFVREDGLADSDSFSCLISGKCPLHAGTAGWPAAGAVVCIFATNRQWGPLHHLPAIKAHSEPDFLENTVKRCKLREPGWRTLHTSISLLPSVSLSWKAFANCITMLWVSRFIFSSHNNNVLTIHSSAKET